VKLLTISNDSGLAVGTTDLIISETLIDIDPGASNTWVDLINETSAGEIELYFADITCNNSSSDEILTLEFLVSAVSVGTIALSLNSGDQKISLAGATELGVPDIVVGHGRKFVFDKALQVRAKRDDWTGANDSFEISYMLVGHDA